MCSQQRILETTIKVVTRVCFQFCGPISERVIPEDLQMTFLQNLPRKISDFSLKIFRFAMNSLMIQIEDLVVENIVFEDLCKP